MTEQEKNSAQTPGDPPARTGNKPVVVYIMILFIAAFLLMALSFLMHQRSNTEVAGKLQSSVSALQEMQNLQEQVRQLQEELEESQAAADAFQDASETARNQASALEEKLSRTVTAMNWFCQLNEAYILEEPETCRTILEKLEENREAPLYESLPKESDGIEGSQTAPYDRYLEIRSAMAESGAEGEE